MIQIRTFLASYNWRWIINNRSWQIYGVFLFYYAYFCISLKTSVIVIFLKYDSFSRVLKPLQYDPNIIFKLKSHHSYTWTRLIKPLQVSRIHPSISPLFWPSFRLPLPQYKFIHYLTSLSPVLAQVQWHLHLEVFPAWSIIYSFSPWII